MASLSGILFVVSDMPLSAERECLYIPQTEYGSGLAFYRVRAPEGRKAHFKACKCVDDISPHGTAKCGLNAIKSASEDFLKPAVTGYSYRCFARLRAIILPRVSDG